MTGDSPTDHVGGRILVGVDGSGRATEALRWARREAQLRDLRLTAVMAWDHLEQRHGDGDRDFDPHDGQSDAQAALRAAVEIALGPDVADVECRAVCGHPAAAVLEAGADAALVVVGARGLGGFTELLLGSTSHHVLHHATRPVAVIRDSSPTRIARTNSVVVGIDGSETSMAALHWAVEEARLRQAALVVLHAWHVPYAGEHPFTDHASYSDLLKRAATDAVSDALAAAAVPRELPVDRHVVQRSAAAAILDAGKDADLIVVGGRGIGGFADMMLGSVSHHVARHATRPVVVVPCPTDHGAPV